MRHYWYNFVPSRPYLALILRMSVKKNKKKNKKKTKKNMFLKLLNEKSQDWKSIKISVLRAICLSLT